MSNSQVDHRYNILIESRLTKLETIIESQKLQFDKFDSRMDRLDSRIDRLESKFDKHFYWTTGLILIAILIPSIQLLLKVTGVYS